MAENLRETTLAAQVMDAWATEGLIDGDVTFDGDDPEWPKAKLAVKVLLAATERAAETIVWAESAVHGISGARGEVICADCEWRLEVAGEDGPAVQRAMNMSLVDHRRAFHA